MLPAEDSGRLVTVQAAPDRVQTTGSSELWAMPTKPATTHELADVQETLVGLPVVCPDASGRLASVQVVPESVSTAGA